MKNSTKDIIHVLSSGPVIKYIQDHEHTDIAKAILKNKALFGIPTSRLFEQIAARRKAKEKLPLFYNTDGIIYPPAENLEQASSERTATYKSSIVESISPHGRPTVADLTGGYGVDSFFLSRVAEKVDYVERDASLLEIARHNHGLLGAINIQYHVATAEEFLQASKSFDVVFVDPSRRTESKKKIHAFEESSPDLVSLAPIIFEKAQTLLVKASPLLDIQAGMDKLRFVKSVYVLSVNNECKEVLFLCEKEFRGIAEIVAVNFTGNNDQVFTFTFPEEQQQEISFSDPLTYIYEPNASIMKAGAFRSICARYRLKKIHTSTHLYTANEYIDNFPGRRFRIEALVRGNKSELKQFFPEGKANVTTRNYPLTPDELKKKTGLKDGGEKFLIGFSGMTKKFLVVATRL